MKQDVVNNLLYILLYNFYVTKCEHNIIIAYIVQFRIICTTVNEKQFRLLLFLIQNVARLVYEYTQCIK